MDCVLGAVVSFLISPSFFPADWRENQIKSFKNSIMFFFNLRTFRLRLWLIHPEFLRLSLLYYAYKSCKSYTYKMDPIYKQKKLKSLTEKETCREKLPSKNTRALSKGMNIDIWVVGTSNQRFMRGSYTETKFSKEEKIVTE